MSITSWIWRRGGARRALPCVLVVLAITACGFKRPDPLVNDAAVDDSGVADSADGSDTGVGCDRDGDCGGTTPFCVERTCSVCKDSTTCPVARPACDVITHDCRNCVKDSECDSGACDLAAGSCVEQSAILYVSPTGTQADPCARLLPCSLDKATSVVDLDHPYIVLLPGIHVSRDPVLNAQKVTVCGNDATIDANFTHFQVLAGSSLTMRDLKMVPQMAAAGLQDERESILGTQSLINSNDSKVVLEKVLIDVTGLDVFALTGGSEFFIRNSEIRSAGIHVSGNVVVDESTFASSELDILETTDSSVTITNSVFFSSASKQSVLRMADAGTATNSGEALVANNTFVGGFIACGGGAEIVKLKHFESNIFENTTNTGSENSLCSYYYNLFNPSQVVSGFGNISGEPRFVNLQANDLHLVSGSPAIDAASPQPRLPSTHDHDGTSRPQGLRSDMGAYEYSP